MGQINQPSNLLDRIKRAERELQKLWKAVGLASATISRGGLTLLRDAFLRMVDDNDDEIVYIGPDAGGKQIFRLRREGGVPMMFTAGNEQFGRDYWAMTDSNGRVIVSDDAETGPGMARPWLPLVLYPEFVSGTADGQAGALGYPYLHTDDLVADALVWRGWASVQHPWVRIFGVFGPASTEVTATTYRMLFNGVEVGAWSPTSLSASWYGRFDVRDFVGEDFVDVQIRASATGTGFVALHYLGGYLI